MFLEISAPRFHQLTPDLSFQHTPEVSFQQSAKSLTTHQKLSLLSTQTDIGIMLQRLTLWADSHCDKDADRHEAHSQSGLADILKVSDAHDGPEILEAGHGV